METRGKGVGIRGGGDLQWWARQDGKKKALLGSAHRELALHPTTALVQQPCHPPDRPGGLLMARAEVAYGRPCCCGGGGAAALAPLPRPRSRLPWWRDGHPARGPPPVSRCIPCILDCGARLSAADCGCRATGCDGGAEPAPRSREAVRRPGVCRVLSTQGPLLEGLACRPTTTCGGGGVAAGCGDCHQSPGEIAGAVGGRGRWRQARALGHTAAAEQRASGSQGTFSPARLDTTSARNHIRSTRVLRRSRRPSWQGVGGCIRCGWTSMCGFPRFSRYVCFFTPWDPPHWLPLGCITQSQAVGAHTRAAAGSPKHDQPGHAGSGVPGRSHWRHALAGSTMIARRGWTTCATCMVL